MSPADLERKIVLPDDLDGHLSALARPWVFTNGVFDLLHRGHVGYLCAASELGASLIVAINTDASARRLGKGPDRPLNTAADRAWVLAGLAAVTCVTFFDTPTPVPLIARLRPDVYVKGGDYDMDRLEEARLVRSWGGHAQALRFFEGYSTTLLAQRLRGGQQPE